jgi:hypothetical protein
MSYPTSFLTVLLFAIVFLGVGCTRTERVVLQPFSLSQALSTPEHSSSSESALTTSTHFAIDSALVENGIYRLPEGGLQVRLRNGAGSFVVEEGSRGNQNFVIRGSAQLEEGRAIGDIDGDGRMDAIVSLRVEYGGTGSWSYVYLILLRDGRFEIVPAFEVGLGDREWIRSMKIGENGLLMFDLRVHGPEDAACCPSQDVTRRFRYNQGHLVPIDS